MTLLCRIAVPHAGRNLLRRRSSRRDRDRGDRKRLHGKERDARRDDRKRGDAKRKHGHERD
jgi:hypothetical protein